MAQVDNTHVAREFIGSTVGVAYPEIETLGFTRLGKLFRDGLVITLWSDQNGNTAFSTAADNIGQYANLVAVL